MATKKAAGEKAKGGAPRKPGRPSSYTLETAEAICEAIARGKALHRICEAEGMPDPVTVYRWLNENEEFRNRYARARERQADLYAAEIIEIADDSSDDELFVESSDASGAGARRVCNNEFVQRSKLRVDARKWAAARLAPKKYGDRVMNEITGADGGPVEINEVQRAARIAAILSGAKRRAGK